MGKKHDNVGQSAAIYVGSVANSIGSPEMDDVHSTILKKVGICRGEPVTESGKALQLVKMLCLNLLPIIGLWAYSVYTLVEKMDYKTLNEQTNEALKVSLALSEMIHKLQRERDMSMLYLSALGPETKTFLLAEYIETDRALAKLSVWPVNVIINKRKEFQTKEAFQEYLSRHRQVLSPQFDERNELSFYTDLIDAVIVWLYESIDESKFAAVWKDTVAYLKVSLGKEDAGLERALGTMFYGRGGFPSHDLFEMYNNRIHTFRSEYYTARLYSDNVDDLGDYGVQSAGQNLTDVLANFRYEIQHHDRNKSYKDMKKAQWFFDNMTIYIDTLLEIQNQVAEYAILKLDGVIEDATQELVINATFLVLVILVCPMVIYATENLTSNIQKYAITLIDKTNELTKEQARTNSLLYQMVPKPVADKLKKNVHIDAEYFKSVTIFFTDIYGFARMCSKNTPLEIVQLLNQLYGMIDDLLDDYDVYKVETVNDCYMIASGLPNRNGGRHVSEIANLAIDLMKIVKVKRLEDTENKVVSLRIGINTGPCMAGIVGSVMPRYCLFGDTVNTASRMKSYSQPNKIQISHTTYMLLNKLHNYVMTKRGSVNVKGKGEMKTYWLQCRRTESMDEESNQKEDIPKPEKSDLPGEIMEHDDPAYKAALNFPLPGRQFIEPKSSSSSEKKENERVTAKVMPVPTETEEEPPRERSNTKNEDDEVIEKD